MGCWIRGRSVALIGADGLDRTRDFPAVAAAARRLRVRSALLDGVVAIATPDGRTSSRALRDWLAGRRSGAAVYFAFDLLAIGGRDLRRAPLRERRRELARIVSATGPIRESRALPGTGPAVLREACRLGFAGIVSKHLDSACEAGTSAAWLKTKCVRPAAVRREQRRVELAGIRLSHPERLVYPADGITKLDLARYHDEVADWELPHLRGRPLTLLRCPGAIGAGCHFMKHSKVWAPEPLRRVRIQEQRKLGEYLIADTRAAIVALVQMDAIELHTWNTRDSAVEQPDRIVFDLDPGPATAWPDVVEGARLLRSALQTLGLRSFVKTTGGRGLHVVVPLLPERDWSECLAFARDLAAAIVRLHPRRYTIAFAKAGRERQILVDYLRNNRTNTSIAAFSPRARPAAPVSVPLSWSELTTRLAPQTLTVKTVPKRLRSLRSDPWAEAWSLHQRLGPEAMRAVRSL